MFKSGDRSARLKNATSREAASIMLRIMGCAPVDKATIGPSAILDPLPKRCTDFVRRVLLNEVNPLDGHFHLVRPRPTELTLDSYQDRPRFCVDKQLGHVTGCEPSGVLSDDRIDVGRVSLDRDLARPGQGRPPGFPLNRKRATILVHLFATQPANDRRGQN